MSLQKGIVEALVDNYTVKVRIPKYDKISSDPYGVKTSDLSEAVICSIPGAKITYSIGDIVIVDFENNELAKPIILGLLYKETGDNSILEMPEIDDKINELNSQVSELKSFNLYTHIKYSNDNGITFTSLFDKVDPKKTINEENTSVLSVSSDNGIIIDNTSSILIWSAKLNDTEKINDFNIETTIIGYDFEDNIVDSIISTDFIIDIPNTIRNCNKVVVSYILYIPTIDYDVSNYSISLITDKEELGILPGKYIGTMISENEVPSTSVTDYSWALNNEVNKKDLLNLQDSISTEINNINSINEKISDNINIIGDNIVIGQDKSKLYLDNSDEKYIDNIENSIVTPKIQFIPFEQRVITIDNEPHFQLLYNGNLFDRQQEQSDNA